MISWYYPCGEKGEGIDDFVCEYKKYIYDKSLRLKIENKTINVFNNNSDRDDELHNRLLSCGTHNTEDIKKIIEWKTGSKFIPDSNELNTYNHGKVDLNAFITSIMENIEDLAKKSTDTPEDVFKTLCNLKKTTKANGIGPVYILTILYFLSKGACPIYDRFAHIACLAITENYKPPMRVKYYPLDSYPVWAWDDYRDYCKLVGQIFGTEGIRHDQDLALWVYGHCFNRK